MRKALSALVTAVATAALSLSTATPASAADYCFGAPSEPLAYVCIGVTGVTVGDPQVTETTVPVTVISLCYGLGCTQETTYYVTAPWVSGLSVGGRPNVTVYWNGYSLPGDARGMVQEIVDSIYIDPICLQKPNVCVP